MWQTFFRRKPWEPSNITSTTLNQIRRRRIPTISKAPLMKNRTQPRISFRKEMLPLRRWFLQLFYDSLKHRNDRSYPQFSDQGFCFTCDGQQQQTKNILQEKTVYFWKTLRTPTYHLTSSYEHGKTSNFQQYAISSTAAIILPLFLIANLIG